MRKKDIYVPKPISIKDSLLILAAIIGTTFILCYFSDLTKIMAESIYHFTIATFTGN